MSVLGIAPQIVEASSYRYVYETLNPFLIKNIMIQISSRHELDAELKKNKQVLALFYATWCPYCIRFVPVFDNRIKAFGFERVIHVLLDDYDNPLWDDYNVGAVPTVILFEDSKVSKRLDGRLGGGLNEQQLNSWLKQFEKA